MSSVNPTSVAPLGVIEENQPRRMNRLMIAALVLALLLAAGYWYWSRGRGAGGTINLDGAAWAHITPADMDVKISRDGELGAVNNIDINCQVEGLSTITQLVKEGTYAHKGDVLITLDGSAIQVKIDDSTLAMQQGEDDLTNAREMKEIQENVNATALDAGKVALELAKLDMQSYTEGLYPQQLSNAQTAEEMADLTLKNAQDDLDQTNKLFTKGFVTAADVKKAELAVTNAKNGLDQAKTALKVLKDFQHQMDLATKKNNLAQAEQVLARTERQNAAAMAQKTADVQQKEGSLAVLKRRVQHYKEQYDYCTIKAPADGLVVYASSSDRYQQTPFIEGATVRERQALLRLPDTGRMKAVIRIGEAMVSHFRVDPQNPMRAVVNIVGYPHPIGATVTRVAVLADSQARSWNPDLKEYPVDLELDQTPASLKPGVGCKAEVMIDHLHDVMAVPMDALYSVGPDHYVFVRHGDDVDAVKVTLGESNDTEVEITSGLTAGQDVLRLQMGEGRAILAKKGISTTPATQPTETPKTQKTETPVSKVS